MFGFAMAVQNLTWGLAQPFTGMIADRYGSAKVVRSGLVFLYGGAFLHGSGAQPRQPLFTQALACATSASRCRARHSVAIYGALRPPSMPASSATSWALGLAGAIGP